MMLAKGVSLGEVTGSRDNNFNLIRMIAASGVLVSHAFPIALGAGAAQPFEAATGFTLGWICVAIFFAISGFLIARSFDRKTHVSGWFSARVARLFPGLIVVSLLIALVYGPVFTSLPLETYFSRLETWTYVPRNVTLVSLQFGLPGVFETLPYPNAINGSLWTLIYEVACYAGVFVTGVLGALASRQRFALVFALYLAAFAGTGLPAVAEYIPAKLEPLRLLSFPFALGMAFYVWRGWVRLSWIAVILLAALAAALHETTLFESAFLVAIAYSTFVLAYCLDGPLRRYNAIGDYSYGMYVYAFPVQQAAVALVGPMTPFENMAIAFPVTLLLAVASWYMVEKPALARRHDLAKWLQSWRRVLTPTQGVAHKL